MSAPGGGLLPLLDDDEAAHSIGEKGKQIVANNRGALKRLMVL